MWVFRLPFRLNFFLHSVQLNASLTRTFFPDLLCSCEASPHLWVFSWVYQVNLFPQTLQPKRFSSVCTDMCSVIRRLCAKRLSQNGQLKGFSPVWILICSCRVPFWLKPLPQNEHSNGFSPVWILMWARMFPLQLKRFGHTEQLNGFSPVCVLIWFVRWSLRQNIFPQLEQPNDSLTRFSSNSDFGSDDLSLLTSGGSGSRLLAGSASSWIPWVVFFFVPVWILMCLLTSPLYLKCLLHTEQQKGFSPVWSLMWLMEFPFWENRLPQIEQLNGFSPVWILMCAFRCGFLPNLWPHSEQLNDRSMALKSIMVASLLFRGFKPDSDLLDSCHSPSLTSVSEDSEVLCSGSKPQSSMFTSDRHFSSLFTETVENSLRSTSSCSSLKSWSLWSSWVQLEIHSCWSSSPMITFLTSDGKTEIQTDFCLTLLLNNKFNLKMLACITLLQ